MAEQYLNKPGVQHLWESMKSYTTVEVAKALAGAGIKIKILDNLPESGEEMVLYFIKSEKEEETNIYEEYMWVNNKWELIGTTKIDLSDYWSKSDLVALTTEEIDAILAEDG